MRQANSDADQGPGIGEARAIDDLRPDPANPRVIEDAAAAGLGRSMHDYGDLAGLTWNRRTGCLVTGHQRMARLRAAGATTWVQTSETEGYIEHPVTHERFHVRIVDMDERTARVANLAANSPEIAGSYTAEAVAQLEALVGSGFDLGPLRLDDLLEGLRAEFPAEPEAGQTDPDAVPEPPAQPVTRIGDLWLLGRVVQCPKCRRLTDV